MRILMPYPFEIYKLKVLERLDVPGKRSRIAALKKAHYNLFKIPAEKVIIDFLTDSGTSALSQKQVAQMAISDESYASAKSWKRFERAVQKFSGRREVIPVHQGRAAEKIIAEVFFKKGDIAFSNGFFDTTRANFEHCGVKCIDTPCAESVNLDAPAFFKGNINLEKLRDLLDKHCKKARSVLMTLTNNTGGGQPASLNNIKKARKLAHQYGLIFIIDACRVAENSYFVWLNEQGCKGNPKNIIREVFSLADLAYVSAKKDGLSNGGGFIVTNNLPLASKIREIALLYEGFITYGGMTGRDLESVAQGLKEVVRLDYLEYRIKQTAYLHQELSKLGIPLINPSGGHAVYVDAKKFMDHVPVKNFPGQALSVALYVEGGVRSVSVGSLMLGSAAKHELVRLAIPRRTHTQSHFDYVAETFRKVIRNKREYKGYKVAWQPSALRHFTCKLKPI